MKKKARKAERREPAAVPDDSVHIRLCHFCFHLNESDNDVYRCDRCKRLLTVEPFWGYLDEQDRAEKQASQDDEEEAPAAEGPQGSLITGLSVLW